MHKEYIYCVEVGIYQKQYLSHKISLFSQILYLKKTKQIVFSSLEIHNKLLNILNLCLKQVYVKTI